MANSYYTRLTNFVPGNKARSAEVEGELDLILAGFDLLPSTPATIATGRVSFAVETMGATVDAFTVVMDTTRTSNVQGDAVLFEATHTNIGAATLAVDSIAAVPIVRSDGSATSGGEIISGLIYDLRFDSSGSRFQLMNMDPVTASDVTRVVGTSTDDPTSPGTFNASLPWENANGDQIAQIAFLSSTDLLIQNAVHGGLVRLESEDSAGTSRLLFSGAPDGSAVLYHIGGLKFSTTAPGVAFRGSGAGDPTTGGVQTAAFQIENSAGVPSSRIAYEGTVDLVIRNEVHGGLVKLESQDSGGANQLLVSGDPGGSVVLHDLGIVRVETSASGLTLRGSGAGDPTAGDAQTILLGLENSSGDAAGRVTFGGDTTLALRNEVHGGLTVVQSEDTGGVIRTMFLGDPDGSSQLLHTGTARVTTNAQGLNVIGSGAGVPSSGDSQTIDVILANSASATAGRISYVGDTILAVRNEVHGGLVAVQSEDAGGTLRSLFLGDPDGSSQLLHAGSARVTTNSQGVNVVGSGAGVPSSGGSQTIDIILANSASATAGRLSYEGSVNLGIKNLVHGGLINLESEDSVGTNRVLFSGDPDGAVAIYHNGTINLSTSANGADFQGTIVDQNGSTSSAHYIVRNSIGGIAMRTLTATGEGGILQASAAGAIEESWIKFDRNGSVTLYSNGLETLRSRTETDADQGTGGDVKDGTSTFRPVGFNVMPLYDINANDSFDLAHNGMFWHKSTGGSVTYTCDNDGNTPIGSTYVVANTDTEDLTIAAGSGVTLRWLDGSGATPPTGNRTVALSGVATVYKITDTSFFIWGSGIT